MQTRVCYVPAEVPRCAERDMELVFQCHTSPLVEQVNRCSGRSGWNCNSLTVKQNVISKILHQETFETSEHKVYFFSTGQKGMNIHTVSYAKMLELYTKSSKQDMMNT